MEINEVKGITGELATTKFPKSGRVLTFFIFKIHCISSSISRCCESKDYYSACILFRSLLEHYFRYLYVYTRALKDDSDTVGEEYYGKLKGYEDYTAIKSILNLSKKLTNKPSSFTLNGKSNERLCEIGSKFEIKKILVYLNNGITNDDISPAFRSFFTDYCKKYYDLSSFVHGGPFAEGYINMYSEDTEGMNGDLEYFSKKSIDISDLVVKSNQIFLDIAKSTNIKDKDNYEH